MLNDSSNLFTPNLSDMYVLYIFHYLSGVLMKFPADIILELRHAFRNWMQYLYPFDPENAHKIGSTIKDHINDLSDIYTGTLVDFIPLNLNFEYIKADKIQCLLPEPTQADSALYKDFYATLNELQKRHLLAHQFGLRGTTSLNGIDLFLPSSSSEFMVHSMQDSFNTFYDIRERYLDPAEFGIAQEDLSNILRDIQTNLKLTDPKSELIDSIISKGHHFSLMYFTTDPSHWTSIVASNNTIIFSDRSSDSILKPIGITICEMPHAPNHAKILQQLLLFREQSNLKPTRTSTHAQNIENHYTLLAKIPLSLQKADNCGWTSGAKTIIYSNAILCFQEYFENAGLNKNEALTRALDCSRILYHKWAHDFDRVESLRSYIEYHKNNTNALILPDLIELGKILLQSEQKTAPYRIAITKLINEFGLITDEIKLQAYHSLLNDIQITLDDRLQSNEYAEEYLDLYLSSEGTMVADQFILNNEIERVENEKIIFEAVNKATPIGISRRLAIKLFENNVQSASDFLKLTVDPDDYLNINAICDSIMDNKDYLYYICDEIIKFTDLIALRVTPEQLTHIMALIDKIPDRTFNQSDLESIIQEWHSSQNSPKPKP